MNIIRSMVSRSKTIPAFFFLLTLLGAAVFALPAHSADVITGSVGTVTAPADYIIGAEDVLEISIWKNADLSKTVTVRPDGKISLPLIGDVQAAGLSPSTLRDKIVSRLKEYQETAVVSVIVQSSNSYKIYIMGEVRTPGQYVLKSKTSVLQAISLAGGFTQFASKNSIVLIRKKSDGVSEEKIDIRFKDLVYSDEDRNLILKAGDTIFVP